MPAIHAKSLVWLLLTFPTSPSSTAKQLLLCMTTFLALIGTGLAASTNWGTTSGTYKIVGMLMPPPVACCRYCFQLSTITQADVCSTGHSLASEAAVEDVGKVTAL
jgi:hypothetical protein